MKIETQFDVRSLFDFRPSTGELIWKPRPINHFPDESYQKRWNTRCAGKPAGSLGTGGYLRINTTGHMYLVHRLIWLWVYGDWPRQVDHINGNRTDNRVENLRSVDKIANARNTRRPTTNTSGVVGVSYDPRDALWHAYIGIGDGTRRSLGYFKTKAEACAARQAGERLLGYHKNHGRAA